MAFKTHIDNATGNQPGTISSAETAILSEGVHDLARGDFLVSGKASLNVDIAKGEAFVQNDNYVYGSMDQRMFASASSATETVAVTSNSSGNPRIDIVCLKIDTAATPGVQGVGSSSIVVVAGTPAASPTAPAVPSNHLLLAQVAVANGATTTTGNVTDLRVQAGLNQTGVSWQTLTNTFVYASADSPTFTMTVSSTDLTGYIYVGQKIRLRQSNAYKYFIVTAIAFSTNTTITVFGGTDYTLANATIQELAISTSRAPVGFPLDPLKWSSSVTVTGVTQNSPVQNTWYNNASNVITVPIGCIAGYEVAFGADRAAASPFATQLTLSSANNSESDTLMTTKVSSGATFAVSEGTRRRLTPETSKTTRYLNVRTTTASMSNLYIEGSSGRIFYTCPYL